MHQTKKVKSAKQRARDEKIRGLTDNDFKNYYDYSERQELEKEE